MSKYIRLIHRRRRAAAVVAAGVPKVSEWAERALGFVADEQQRAVLDCGDEQVLLCCARQWGKSSLGVIAGLHRAFFHPGSRVLIVAPGERQGHLFLEGAEPFLRKLGLQARKGPRHRVSLTLENGSDLVAVPPVGKTIRGFRKISLMIFDEAAQLPDHVFPAAEPGRLEAKGRLWMMSTPYGQAGHFYEAWAHGGSDWTRFLVRATDCGRYDQEALARYGRMFGETLLRQEYLCEFVPCGGQLIDREVVEKAVSAEPRALERGHGWTERMEPHVHYFVGVDVGLRRDPTSIAVVRREVRATGMKDAATWEPLMETVMTLEEVRTLELLTPYAEVTRVVQGLLRRLQPGSQKTVVVDAGGAGDALAAELKAAELKGTLIPVVLTGGLSVGKLPHATTVPRAALLENLRRMLEIGMFTIRPEIPELAALTRELTGLGAAGYGGHDDRAFALALALWGAKPKAWVGPVGEVLDIPIIPALGGQGPVVAPGMGMAYWMEARRKR